MHTRLPLSPVPPKPHLKPTILLSGMPVALASQVRAPTISSLDGLPTCVIVCVAACAQTNRTGLGVGGSMQGAHSEGRGDSARAETGTSQSKLGVQSARCAIHAGWGLTNLIARHVQRLHGGRDGVCSSKPAGVVEWLGWLAATAHCKGLGCARRLSYNCNPRPCTTAPHQQFGNCAPVVLM